jgi:coenzyme F420-reducing hydrogenase alpha subunit
MKSSVTKTPARAGAPSRGPREKARKKRAANQLRKVNYHQARIEELEKALSAIREILDEDGCHFDLRLERILKIINLPTPSGSGRTEPK